MERAFPALGDGSFELRSPFGAPCVFVFGFGFCFVKLPKSS